MKVGIVGTSRYKINMKEGQRELENSLKNLKITEIVSGSGAIPYIAYKLSRKMNIPFTWFCTKQSSHGKLSGKFVEKKIIVGEKHGDDSEDFIKYIDVLIRIGGGYQSHSEVALMRKIKPNNTIIEKEIEFFG